jgi:hypothetical protein
VGKSTRAHSPRKEIDCTPPFRHERRFSSMFFCEKASFRRLRATKVCDGMWLV